jgi:hypothetical protein
MYADAYLTCSNPEAPVSLKPMILGATEEIIDQICHPLAYTLLGEEQGVRASGIRLSHGSLVIETMIEMVEKEHHA